MAFPNNVGVFNPPGLDHIVHLLMEAAPDVISFSDSRALACGTLYFSATHPIKIAANLFKADQLSGVNVHHIKKSANLESHNWLWITKCCPVDMLIFEECSINYKLDGVMAAAFRKSKGVQFGKLASKFADQQDPHCRVGQVIGYWLYKLYSAQGLPDIAFPECLIASYTAFLNWKGYNWGYLRPCLPFTNKNIIRGGVTTQKFPFALLDNDEFNGPTHPGFGKSKYDADFRMVNFICRHPRNMEIFTEYIDSGFNGTLVDYSEFAVFDSPVEQQQENERGP